MISNFPFDTGRKLNVDKTFRRRSDIFWTSHVRSVFILCPGDQKWWKVEKGKTVSFHITTTTATAQNWKKRWLLLYYWCQRRLLNVLCTFNLRPVSREWYFLCFCPKVLKVQFYATVKIFALAWEGRRRKNYFEKVLLW